jgi:hypothetical protein
MSFFCCTSQVSTGLKGTRKLQQFPTFGGIALTSADTNGKASSINFIKNDMANTAAPAEGVTGNALVAGMSFGSGLSISPGVGISSSEGEASGFGNSTTTQSGGTTSNVTKGIAPELSFGNGFGDFASAGGAMASFGGYFFIPGRPGTPEIAASIANSGSSGKKSNKKSNKNTVTIAAAPTPAVPGTPDVFYGALQTGGGGGGFGFTLGGGVGNVSGDAAKSNAYGTAQSAGFGSALTQSYFFNGIAGGMGGGMSAGTGGGNVASVKTFPAGFVNGISAFNGTGGGISSGGGGAYIGFNPVTPVILGTAPVGGPADAP